MLLETICVIDQHTSFRHAASVSRLLKKIYNFSKFLLLVFLIGKPSQEEPFSQESPTASQVMSVSSSEQQPLFSIAGASNPVTITATITKIDDEVGFPSTSHSIEILSNKFYQSKIFRVGFLHQKTLSFPKQYPRKVLVQRKSMLLYFDYRLSMNLMDFFETLLFTRWVIIRCISIC